MRLIIALTIFLVSSSATFARDCGDNRHEECVLWIACECVPDILPSGPKLPDVKPEDLLSGGLNLLYREAAKQNVPILSQVAVSVNELSKNLETELRTGIENTLNTTDKAIRDSAQSILTSVNDTVDATRAVGHYAERSVAGWERVFTAAEQRLREGKVVDAVWHFTTDQWQEQNMNAAQLAQENEIAAAAMKSAAFAYGGPAGAAAFAAWQTYNASGGNLDLALRAGAYSYALSVAGGDVSAMKSMSLGQAAQKAAMAGAVGGLAVAASGGTNEEALDAFVKSGGAVLVQAGRDYLDENVVQPGQTAIEENYTNPLREKMDSFCVTATGETCANASAWYARSQQKVAELEEALQTKPTIVVSGDWAISWDPYMVATPGQNQPAVVLTFVGNGSPVQEALEQVAALTSPTVRPPVGSFRWVPYRDEEGRSMYFNLSGDIDGAGTPEKNQMLIAKSDIRLHGEPEREVTGEQLFDGDTFVVFDFRTVAVNGAQQEWIKFSLDSLRRASEVINEK